LKLSGSHLELVSLHIPKTAGTSFRTILQDRYGKGRVLHFDIYSSGTIEVKGKPFKRAGFKRNTSVLHGHFSYKDLHKFVDIKEGTPLITWLRHPVDRVVSNYYFLNKIIAHRLKERANENLMSRMGKSLVEFAQHSDNQNVMSRFLDGCDLSQFSFIGIQDHFEEELARLEKVMNWPSISNRIHNATALSKKEISAIEYEQIAKLNQLDMQLYEDACFIRNQSLSLNKNL
jgi:hypothetical protein